MKLEDISNKSTLNIFTDVSVKQIDKKFNTCYGAVAIVEDRVIDELFRFNSNSTVNEGDAKGIQTGIYFALKYRDQFETINLFSDSLISVNNIRYGYQKWYNIDDKLMRFDKNNPDVKNSSVYIQILDLLARYKLNVNFWHVKGHIGWSKKDLSKLIYAFIKNNNLFDNGWDYNFARYLAKWNNYVDIKSRDILHANNNLKVVSPINFTANKFETIKNSYNYFKEESR